MRQGMRRAVKAVSAVGLAVLMIFGAESAANAWHFVDDGVAIRSAPYTTGTTIYGRGYNGQQVAWVDSYLSGSQYSYNNINGSGTSQYWWYLNDIATGVAGWSGRYFVSLSNN